MSTFVPTVLDVEAMDDVVTDVTEASDSMSVDDAVALRVALVSHRKEVDAAIAALDQQLVLTMELPRTHGGWIHIVRPKKEKERFDHEAIAGKVLAFLKDENDSEDEMFLFGFRAGARQAIQTMTDLYVAPSTTAKVTVLDKLGIERRKDKPGSVRTWTPGEKHVEVTPLLSEVQE